MKDSLTRSVLFTLAISFTISAIGASTTTPAVRAEINTLLEKLQASGCEFSRNGLWHSGAEAKTHLIRKLEHLEAKEVIHSTEQFITLAASSSSVSGKSYQVRCGKNVPMESQQWLGKELQKIRSVN